MTHTLYNITYHGLNVSSFLRRIIYLKRTDWRYFFGFDKNHKDGQDSLKIQLNGLDYDCFKETYGSFYCHTWMCEIWSFWIQCKMFEGYLALLSMDPVCGKLFFNCAGFSWAAARHLCSSALSHQDDMQWAWLGDLETLECFVHLDLFTYFLDTM